MNNLEQQAKFVQDALRAGKKVAVMVARQAHFERLVAGMIPDDLPQVSGRRDRYHFKFTNGALLTFVPSYQPDRTRGVRVDLAAYYLMPREMVPLADREREQETWNRLAESAEMFELEMP